jgi:AcrR family transcriptional regulator
MTEKGKKDTKRNILEAAMTLFAQKGYHAVGIREITKTAQVNIAMVNYYFGGKIGILKEIINQAYERHRQAITQANIELPPEEHIKLVIKNYIDFFRENTELALVAFDTVPFDIPEIIDLKISWAEKHMELLHKLFNKLGLDLQNDVHMNLFNGLLGNIILTHFRGRYSWEMATHEQCVEFSDKFYRQFTHTLTQFYLAGVKGVVEQKKQKR